jgi:two-component system sensor histidine kinase PilS (NtrC family)
MGQMLPVLRWLFMGRIVVATAIFAAALVMWRSASELQTLVATLGLLGTIVVTAGGVWWMIVKRRLPGSNFLYGQILFDTLLVTAIVHITHDPANATLSPYAPLYIFVIAAAALLLPLPGGMLIGALASLLYFADVLLVDVVSMAALLQVVLFGLVAIATAALGDRLRRAGRALGAAESELRQLRLDVNEMLGAIDTGLVTVDGEGRLSHWNEAAVGLLSLNCRDWRSRSVLDELDRCAPGLGTVLRRTLTTRQPVHRYELRLARPDGDRHLSVRTTVLERAGVPWVTAVLQDVTEGKQVEDLLRRAERLQAVAELGASLAHEIRNPLAAIRSAVEQIAGERVTSADRQALRRLVVVESDRLSRLLSEFMEFSRMEMHRWSPVDLGALTRDAIELVSQHPDRPPRAEIELLAPTASIQVDGDRDLLHRAVFNLILNAVQQSGPEGRVSVDVARVEAAELPSSVQLDAPVRLRVTDSGPGVREEDAQRVFDPFYSTRAGGTGLGLALVHRAVEAHQGAILVDGAEGSGACFTVYLPAHLAREDVYAER